MNFRHHEYESFDEIASWLNGLPDQTIGDPCAICEIGEPYVAFRSSGIARPGDEKLVERYVARDMSRKLSEYFDDKSGRIYWRETFVTDIQPTQVHLRMDVNGPDIDIITGENCVMDKNWISVSCYCRLVKAKMKAWDRKEKAA